MYEHPIKFIGTEPYNQKKYRDDFGPKPNPFRIVVCARAHFPDGSTLDLILKFAKHPSEEQVREKGIRLLQNVGILHVGALAGLCATNDHLSRACE